MIQATDRHFFTQIGLDSAALTMLGTVVHSFCEPGEYRGTVHAGDGPEATFYVSVDKSCAVAQVNIDLAALVEDTTEADGDCGCSDPGGRRFVVHPKGYAVFHVGHGAGGYGVNVRRADEDPELKAYDTRTLVAGDIFAASLHRPGTYALRNVLTQAQAEVKVAYPGRGETAYRPPPACHVDVGEEIDQACIELKPLQGLNLHVTCPAHITIELVEPDDGPGAGGSAA